MGTSFTISAGMGQKPTMEDTAYGVLVFGSIPIDTILEQMRLWERRGFDIFDIGIAHALRATLAVTNDEGSERWREEIEARLREEHRDEERVWLYGCDVGASSLTLFSRLCHPENRYLIPSEMERFPGEFPHIPRDEEDFNRCKRMVDRFGWRDRLYLATTLGKTWTEIISRWDTPEPWVDPNNRKG